MRIRVIVVGLGPIGAAIARQLLARRRFELVAAVDVDPAKAGRDVAEVAGLERRTGVRVTADLEAALRRPKPDAAVLCTGSSLARSRPLLEAVLGRRVAVVSTTEELSYPWRSHPSLSRRIDAAARKARVAVVATGVNPGFAMDALPIALTSICERVDAVRVDRVQDARVRRLPFQRKIGAGLSPAEFARRVEAGTVRHVGLTQSVTMIADARGWRLDRVSDEIRPKIAGGEVTSAQLAVEAGLVCGLVQEGIGYRGGGRAIVLHMEAYLGAPEAFDQVTIEGSPRICVRAEGGYHGDIATASIAVNTIPRVLEARPGLHTMRTLALPAFAGEAWPPRSSRGFRRPEM
jgi:hypothetical protein